MSLVVQKLVQPNPQPCESSSSRIVPVFLEVTSTRHFPKACAIRSWGGIGYGMDTRSIVTPAQPEIHIHKPYVPSQFDLRHLLNRHLLNKGAFSLISAICVRITILTECESDHKDSATKHIRVQFISETVQGISECNKA